MTTSKTTKPSGSKHGIFDSTNDINVVGETHEPVQIRGDQIKVGDILQTGKGNTPMYKRVIQIRKYNEGKTLEIQFSRDCAYTYNDRLTWVFVPYTNKN